MVLVNNVTKRQGDSNRFDLLEYMLRNMKAPEINVRFDGDTVFAMAEQAFDAECAGLIKKYGGVLILRSYLIFYNILKYLFIAFYMMWSFGI